VIDLFCGAVALSDSNDYLCTSSPANDVIWHREKDSCFTQVWESKEEKRGRAYQCSHCVRHHLPVMCGRVFFYFLNITGNNE